MESDFSQTRMIGNCIERLNGGESAAREELLALACDRLMRLTRKMKKDFPAVMRWEQTEDVFQNASLRLYRSLESTQVNDSLHFFRLAAVQIRRELIDLARHYQGAEGMGAHHQTQGVGKLDMSRGAPLFEKIETTQDPVRLSEWGEMHEKISQLNDEDREMFDLLFYHELPQEEAAAMLGISDRQVRRRWRTARANLAALLGETSTLD